MARPPPLVAGGGTRQAAPLRALAGAFGLLLLGVLPGWTCGAVPCQVDDDDDPCTLDVCGADEKTYHSYLGDGYPCFFGKLKGACQAKKCVVPCASDAACDDGEPCTFSACVSGACVVKADDNLKPPPDGNACSQDMCLHGEALYVPVPDGQAMCSGGRACEHGLCTGCSTAADCGVTTECRSWACNKGTCVSFNAVPGTKLIAGQVFGDCRSWICDGAGGIDLQVDSEDFPHLPDPCFIWTCNGWTPLRTPNFHAPCLTSKGTGGFCDDKGTCLQCVLDADCPGVGQRCKANICVSCGDGIQNGDETGVDCGGSCGACLSAPCTGDQECATGNCGFTNAQAPKPEKVCCDAPCDEVCFQCSTAGFCGWVPTGSPDVDTCNSPYEACKTGSCKIKTNYPCVQNSDCISGSCVSGTCK